MISRRQLLQIAFGTAVAIPTIAATGFASGPKLAAPIRRLTLNDIIGVAFPAVLHDMRGSMPFVSPILNQAVDNGDIIVPKSAVRIMVEPQYWLVSTPAVWSWIDNQVVRERDSISLATSLMKNLIDAHDDRIIQALESRKTQRLLVLSSYQLSEAVMASNRAAFIRYLHTDVYRIPR